METDTLLKVQIGLNVFAAVCLLVAATALIWAAL